MSGSTAADVSRYYDSNTRRFLLVGTGRGVHAMHRELWGPEVRSARDASDHVNRLLADELSELTERASPTIFDFGCGVGGTLFHLAGTFARARLVGVTVSGRQREIAERLARKLGHADRCEIVQADFDVVDLGRTADAVVAVESFAHTSDAGAFLTNVARHLRPGGRLIVVDDFLARDEAALDARSRGHLERFRAGWRVPAVCTTASLESAAAAHGLRRDDVVDLTPLTRPGSRARDRWVAVLAPVMAGLGLTPVPFCGNMIGGHALQIGLREGFIRYALLAFRRVA